MGNILPNIFREPFNFGNTTVDLGDLLGEQTIKRLRKKFHDISDIELCASLQELVKYLFLCSYSSTSLFFPGNLLIDELWHALITETAI